MRPACRAPGHGEGSTREDFLKEVGLVLALTEWRERDGGPAGLEGKSTQMQEGSRDGQGDGPPWSKAGRVGLGQVREGPRRSSFGLWGAREGCGAGKRHPEMGRVCQRGGR